MFIYFSNYICHPNFNLPSKFIRNKLVDCFTNLSETNLLIALQIISETNLLIAIQIYYGLLWLPIDLFSNLYFLEGGRILTSPYLCWKNAIILIIAILFIISRTIRWSHHTFYLIFIIIATIM